MYYDYSMAENIFLGRDGQSPLTIAFESGRITYTDNDVDLYNSGVNQILSIAASRGHDVYHFSMDDLRSSAGGPEASFTRLVPDQLPGMDDLDMYRRLRVAERQTMPMDEMDIYFVRGDDIKPDTQGVPILLEAEKGSIFLERMGPTLDTCDKYELVTRCPHIPQPRTYAADNLVDALGYIGSLRRDTGSRFVLKDRYGYGCGAQVHLMDSESRGFIDQLTGYIDDYRDVLIQEFCPEVSEGDIVVTFFDGEMIAPMRRRPYGGQWKTNASLGGKEEAYDLSPENYEIAKSVIGAFSDCRFASVDMLESGKVLEINAFPGGNGLRKLYNISVGRIIMDRLEQEAYAARGSHGLEYRVG
jgi:glutathione synthase/RimK-type ligase-like ATP-grasp enzyme